MNKKAAAKVKYDSELASELWIQHSTLPASVLKSIGELNYTRSLRFTVLKELSRLQCEARGAETYDGVNRHRVHRTRVEKAYQRQAWRRRWEWCMYY
jgi:hypothetical protein